MNSDFEELYQQVILDHSRRPRNYGLLEGDAVHVHGDNPSCGDEIHLHVRFSADGGVEDIRFTGMGCAISQASASLMTLKLKGKSRAEALDLLAAFTDVVTAGKHEPPRTLGDLKLLAGVRNFPQRVKCAMLGWRAFEQAAHDSARTDSLGQVVTDGAESPHCA
jgi:nitrogen fixation NifU-like protein